MQNNLNLTVPQTRDALPQSRRPHGDPQNLHTPSQWQGYRLEPPLQRGHQPSAKVQKNLDQSESTERSRVGLRTYVNKISDSVT